jgi:hypothetical protein
MTRACKKRISEFDMNDVVEVQRRASPAPKPQSLAFDGAMLWMGSRETRHLFAIDPLLWTWADLGEAPGTPWGIAVTGRELKLVCGETAEDHRILRRYAFETGFDRDFAIPCPEDTGSQLSYDGRVLYLSQWYNRRLIALGEDGVPERTIDVPHEICGQVFAGGFIYCVTTDDEASGAYYLTQVSRLGESRDLARIPFDARALAHDGRHFWTNHREADEIVCFDVPGLDVRG